MEGGTEAFPELGRHCQEFSCSQLDFLPFKCDACSKVFCLEHRSYKSHDCPKAEEKSRTVVVCGICSMSMERVGVMKEEMILGQHVRSGDCNPAHRKKPKCPVRWCKQVLTFSNTSTCKICNHKVCLSHRFPSDHICNKPAKSSSPGSKFLLAFEKRSAKECGKEVHKTPAATTVKAF